MKMTWRTEGITCSKEGMRQAQVVLILKVPKVAHAAL
jgi:hypothetical protein